jgi:hypothetical protein
LIRDDILIPLDFSNSDYCIDCIKGKHTKKVKKREAKRSVRVLEIIHTNICGSFPVNIKHRLKFVRKMKNSGVIAVSYVKSENNLTDPFTKGLPRSVISMMSKNTGMMPI